MELKKEYIIDYYNKFYENNDFSYYSKKISLKLLKTICNNLSIPKGAKILDIGCGTGFYTDLFRQLGYNSVGIDISQTAIEKARYKYPNSTFNVADALNLPYDKNYFDIIFMFGCSVVNTDNLSRIDEIIQYLLQYIIDNGTIVLIGGTDFSGKRSEKSEWYNHTWDQLKEISYNKRYSIKGPFLSHLRLIYYFGCLGYSRIVTLLFYYFITLLLRFSFQKKVFYFINK
jgi:SAM-dependent methyltransferase